MTEDSEAKPGLERFLTGLARILRPLGPVLLLIFTGLHGLGVLERFPWLEAQFGVLSLWLTTIVLEYALEHREKLTEVKELAQETRIHSAEIRESMHTLHEDFHRDRIDGLAQLLQRLDPKINAVIGPYLDEHIRTVLTADRDHRLELDPQKFLVMYRDALKTYPGARIFATSYPSPKFFWNNSETEQAMRLFIRGGGSMQRIFFLDEPAQCNQPEANIILRRQKEIEVDVHTLVAGVVPRDWKRIFLVEGEGRIGWELTLSRQLDIEKAVIYWGRDRTSELRDLFEKLMKTDGRTPFTAGVSLDPNRSGQGLANADAFRDYEHREWNRPSVVSAFDQYFGALSKASAVQLLRHVAPKPGPADTFLDLASGSGQLAATAAGKSMKVTAVDFSDSAIALGQSRLAEVAFETADVVDLPFLDEGTFRFAASNLGVMHFADPAAAFREAYRVLQPGGRFGFTVWAQQEDEGDVIGTVQAVVEALEDPATRPPDGPAFFRFSQPAEAKNALEACGFRDVRTRNVALAWKLASPEDLYKAFAQGTARTGGRIREQGSSIRNAIRERVAERARLYLGPDGHLHLPMRIAIVTAEKPA